MPYKNKFRSINLAFFCANGLSWAWLNVVCVLWGMLSDKAKRAENS